jgi:hypothetical protein
VERTIATILLEVDLRAPGQKITPRSLEGAACLVEALGHAVSVL